MDDGASNLPESLEPFPLSLLNDYLYCPRRAALKILEGWREANVHTDRGDIVHEHSDLRGYEVVRGVTLLRALPVWSQRLGLNGKCDIVEVHPADADPPGPAPPASPPAGTPPLLPGGRPFRLVPVEFKLGKRRQWDNDDAQLCAQALCLEEMFGLPIARGAVFHADSKRRREVPFTPGLRQLTERAVAEIRQLLRAQAADPAPRLPVAQHRPACEHCSLYDTCLPELTGAPDAVSRASRALFAT